MKLKDITYLEKNFEKFLGGIAVLVIALAVWYYGLNTPNIVEINRQQVGPAQVDQIVLTEAQRLRGQLDSDEVAAPLKNLTVPDYTENFVGKLNQTPAPDSDFPLALGTKSFEGDEGGPGIDNLIPPYHEPDIPEPAIVAARADMGAIAPEEVEANDDLKEFFGAKAPFDEAWVSVVGQFDMKQMMKELTQPADDEHQMIPPAWWQDTFAIVDVQLARQTMKPDGTWPADDQFEIVEPMPGRISFRGVPRQLSGQQATAYLQAINDYRSDIIQPAFYELVGAQWQPPEAIDEEAVAAAGDVEEQVREIKRQLRIKTGRLRIIDKQIDRLQNRGGRSGGSSPRAPVGGLEGVSGEFGEFGPGAGGAAPRPQQQRPSGTNRLLEKRLERLNTQRDEAVQELKELEAKLQELTTGESPDAGRTDRRRATSTPRTGRPRGGEFARGEFGEFGPGGEFGGEFGEYGEFGPGGPESGARPTRPRSRDGLNIMNVDTVDLWASDMTAEPGKTYRYKMRVTVVNVLFNKSNMPEAQAKRHEKKFLIDSGWSGWSKPAKLEKTMHFFASSASPQPAPGQATFDVFKFHGGQWLRQEFTVKPGDPIGGVASVTDPFGQRSEVDFSTGSFLVDINFNYVIPSRLGNMSRKTQMIMIMDEGEMMTRRVDADKNSEQRDSLEQKMQAGVAEASR